MAPVVAPATLPAAGRSVGYAGAQTAASLPADAKPEPVATQLATVLAPAARQPDGSYQVSIRLQPEELGLVHVELHLEGSTVNVSLHADGDATRDMLRQNLGQLRQQLAGGGLTTGRFDVGNGPASGEGNGLRGQQQAPAPLGTAGHEGLAGATTGEGAGAPVPSLQTSGLLDMRL
jgi:flagellar hook-length control protein FliK